MAESAACPAFQLGRPRYDQVSPPLSSANHPLMGFCFQAFRWKTAPSSALQPLRMLRQFVGTKLALICDPILRCLYLNRSNFQLLVNLVEMDEFWLYCSFYSGNDFSSQCHISVLWDSTPLRRTVISLFGSAVNTLRARRRSFSLKSSR